LSPEETVRAYLDAMERRDLAAAKGLLAPGFHMVFPGNKRFGELPDGTPYSGIRFIDRFTVRDGKLVDQNVWNDMGETLNAPRR
jgi:hypothetical protein